MVTTEMGKNKMPPLTFFLDGQYLEIPLKGLEQWAPWNLKGRGAFETLRVYAGKPFAFNEHWSRWQAALKTLGIPAPVAKSEFKRHVWEGLSKNHLKDGRMRWCVWQEKENQAGHVSVLISEYVPLPSQKYRAGFKAAAASLRLSKRENFPALKSIDYHFFLKAYETARAAGVDEALLLNPRGDLVSASRSNIFLIKDGVLATPSLESGCLPGVTRRQVLKLARRLKIKVLEQRLTFKNLLASDEAFLTNSLWGVMPLTSLVTSGGDAKIGSGRRGPLTDILLREYRQLVLREMGG